MADRLQGKNACNGLVCGERKKLDECDASGVVDLDVKPLLVVIIFHQHRPFDGLIHFRFTTVYDTQRDRKNKEHKQTDWLISGLDLPVFFNEGTVRVQT